MANSARSEAARTRAHLKAEHAKVAFCTGPSAPDAPPHLGPRGSLVGPLIRNRLRQLTGWAVEQDGIHSRSAHESA